MPSLTGAILSPAEAQSGFKREPISGIEEEMVTALSSVRSGSSLIYLIRTDDRSNVTGVETLGSTEDLGAGYTSLFPMVVGDRAHLLAYDKTRGGLDVFQLLDSTPWLSKLSLTSKIDSGFDVIEPFVIGNQHHLMCYDSKAGAFEFLGLTDEFSLSKPYRYFRDREPSATLGFTTLKAFVAFGQLGILGYNFDDGHVVMFRLSVRTTSPTGVPPLSLNPVWSHYWAKGWTRFAFFQFGGENFFLKTNVLKPNVNIDHVLDDLSGTVPVGSHLNLEAAERLGIVRSLDLSDEGPHFITYQKTGETTLNRIRSDCLGWTTVASFKSKENAAHVVPLKVGGKAMMLVA
jgi:hypothetical protein